jgi:hypothetical protein
MKIMYFCLARWIMRWFIFKPMYKIQCLIDCGKLNRPNFLTPIKYKWFAHLNYRIGKVVMFYGK